MNNIIEELPGSQRGVIKKTGDPKILRKVRSLFRKMKRKRHVGQVSNLYINVQEITEDNVYLTLNIINQYTGEIKSVNVNSPGNQIIHQQKNDFIKKKMKHG